MQSETWGVSQAESEEAASSSRFFLNKDTVSKILDAEAKDYLEEKHRKEKKRRLEQYYKEFSKA